MCRCAIQEQVYNDDAHTIMAVLNKYEDFIEKGSGNFAQMLENT